MMNDLWGSTLKSLTLTVWLWYKYHGSFESITNYLGFKNITDHPGLETFTNHECYPSMDSEGYPGSQGGARDTVSHSR